jgi:catechol 2,3-dioxygenase-like lactoylglutathione lyase family enzyme/predicted enzyme related to lactoylglutathione lyase
MVRPSLIRRFKRLTQIQDGTHELLTHQTWFRKIAACVLLLSGIFAFALSASAQLFSAGDGPIVYGHHHLYVSNIEQDKKFFIDALGGKTIRVGTSTAEIVEFPNVFVFLNAQAPTGGTKGSVVGHIGFTVRDIAQTVKNIKTNGFQMITSREVGPGGKVKNDVAMVKGRGLVAYALAPDDLIVELIEQKRQTASTIFHDVYFETPDNAAMQAWYVKIFGAKPLASAGLPVVTLPGGVFYFAHSNAPVAPIRGRAIDHIGFEVKNLGEFCERLEAQGVKLDVPYRAVPAFNTHTAHLTDPWGTNIELVDGMASIR